MRSVLIPWLATLLVAGLCACCTGSTSPPDAPPSPVPDAGRSVGTDAGRIESMDSDRDGLCDETERIRGTDPLDADTDDDGFSDFVELTSGYDPILPGSPARDSVHLLRESPTSTVDVVVPFVVLGSGEDYTGAFEDLTLASMVSATASDFYVGSTALYSSPLENVAVVDPTAERFRGVVGLTDLAFEIRFGFGDQLERRCNQAYPFRYNVKRSDGVIVASRTALLVVLPLGETLGSSAWCAPTPPCM